MTTRLLVAISLISVTNAAVSQGSCNEADLDYMGQDLEGVQAIATDCGTQCLFAADPDACMQECMGAQTPLSASCISCFSNQVDCVVDNCFFACAFFPESENCANCVESNCLAPFQECAGIVDLDGDTFTNLTDCDDQNPAVYPDAVEIWYDGVDQNCDGANDFDQDGDGDMAAEYGGSDCNDTDPLVQGGVNTYYIDTDGDGYGAEGLSLLACSLPVGYALLSGDCDNNDPEAYPGAPGTGEGIDNDCNGIVEGAELAADCTGDLNNDQAINSSDLLLFLTDFGCIGSCQFDLDNNNAVDTSDLLILLANYGVNC